MSFLYYNEDVGGKGRSAEYLLLHKGIYPMSKTKTTKNATKATKRGPGRPQKYNRERIVVELRKYEGQQGGLRAAFKGLRKLKSFNNPDKGLDLSFQTVVLIAQKEGIDFKMGRPLEAPKAKKVA